MADSKYGRLFTEADVRRLLAESGGPPDDADVTAILDGFEGAFPPDEPLFVLRASVPGIPLSEIFGVFSRWQHAHPDRVKAPD